MGVWVLNSFFFLLVTIASIETFAGTNIDLTNSVNVTGIKLSNVQLSTAYKHSCAIAKTQNCNTEELFCWGENFTGELGIGSSLTIANKPQKVNLPGTPLLVATGGTGKDFTCAIVDNLGSRELYCWGMNENGQLGIGNITTQFLPVRVNIPGTIKDVKLGSTHSCAISTVSNLDTLFCWGSNSFGELGLGLPAGTTNVTLPSQAVVFPNQEIPVSVSLGRQGTCAISATQKLYCWGNAPYTMTAIAQNSPKLISFPNPISISVGTNFVCVVNASNREYCWGDNYLGQFGIGTSQIKYSTPQFIVGTGNINSIDSGDAEMCLILASGVLNCSGFNFYGQLGNGNSLASSVFQTAISPVGVLNVQSVSTAGETTCAVYNLSTGEQQIHCTGRGDTGELGNGLNLNSNTMKKVDFSSFSSHQTDINTCSVIAAGDYTNCGINASGALKCWGDNGEGEVATGSSGGVSTSASQAVNLTTGVTSVSSGQNEVCAIQNEAAYCWGQNSNGSIGSANPTLYNPTPLPVVGMNTGVTAISVGYFFVCAIKNGGVWCWGDNSFGQFGNGSTTSAGVPQSALILTSGVTAISAGMNTACAIQNGNVFCWGRSISTVPIQITGLNAPAKAISTGNGYACALLNNSEVKCWGDNSNGQLGNNTRVSSAVPVSVLDSTGSANLRGVISIAASGYTFQHTCAVLNNGYVKCWGNNNKNQFGNNTGIDSNLPVDVPSSLGTGNLTDVVQVINGYYLSCAKHRGGNISCWGGYASSYFYGALGNGSFNGARYPVTVQGFP